MQMYFWIYDDGMTGIIITIFILNLSETDFLVYFQVIYQTQGRMS